MNSPFPTYFEEFIHVSRYAKWREDLGRRETWQETVERLVEYYMNAAHIDDDEIEQELFDAIYNLEVMPSMRALMAAGPALDRCHVAAYNCAFMPVDSPRAFDEAMYVLMCGTGMGFSVEEKYTHQLPIIAEKLENVNTTIVVEDSKEGWASGFRQFISMLYAGDIPKWDVSKVRPAGARLKTFGGRASGPEPLVELFKFTIDLFKRAAGRRLTTLEAHDLMCKIADIVVVGGVRRCLPVNSVIPTTKGLKYIKDIRVGDNIITQRKAYKVLDSGPSGIKKQLNISHRFGSLPCSPDHKVAVFTDLNEYDFKLASELKEGDRLVWDALGADFANSVLPAFENNSHFNAKQIEFPSDLDERLAWLVGLIQGDGYVGERVIEITCHTNESEILELAQQYIYELFGLNSVISNGKGNCYKLRINSKALANWFSQHVKKPCVTLRIPEFIKNSSIANRAAYLAGLFDADGRSRPDGVIEQVTTIYKDFHTDIVNVLSSLGIGVSSRFVDRGDCEQHQDAYTINITGKTNRQCWLGLVYTYALKELKFTPKETSANSIDFSYPKEMLGNFNTKAWKSSVLVSHDLIKDHVTNILPTPITCIEQAEDVEMWDIEVEEVNQFTVNGLIVHNSAMISLSDVTDDRMRSAKSGEWWNQNGQRRLANNSAVYENRRPDMDLFMKEWKSLYESKSGERGFFSRAAAQKIAARNGRRKADYEFGTNPCLNN